MEQNFREIISKLGEDLNRDGLKDTPKRAALAFKFLTQGYEQSIEMIVNDALFESDSDEMIIVKDIELYSLCEHHLLPFIGKCHVAYLPKGKIIGLSKIARLVDLFARRLQVQEKLTKQIAETVFEITGASGVGVIIEAQHLCMMMRGVQKQNSTMTTSVMLGTFRGDTRTRAEFLSLVK
jgi:GTP cyclohydrolase I